MSISDAADRAEKFKEQYLNRLKSLQLQPFAHGNLTVRSLLDMREHCLSEFNFHDPYMNQKHAENKHALELLQERLAALADLPFDSLHEQLAQGECDFYVKSILGILETLTIAHSYQKFCD